MAAPHREVILRQRICRACGKLFWICRHCDRGQRYCSESCRQQAYLQERRLANQRHQRSPEGQLDHRDRQRAYRWHLLLAQKSVTDKPSLASSLGPRMPLAITFRRPSHCESPSLRFSGWLRCIVCGRRGRFVDPYR